MRKLFIVSTGLLLTGVVCGSVYAASSVITCPTTLNYPTDCQLVKKSGHQRLFLVCPDKLPGWLATTLATSKSQVPAIFTYALNNGYISPHGNYAWCNYTATTQVPYVGIVGPAAPNGMTYKPGKLGNWTFNPPRTSPGWFCTSGPCSFNPQKN